LELLRSRGIESEVIEYLKTPPSKTALKVLLKQLAMKPRELLRTKEEAYKKAGLDNPTVSDEQILAAMEANPILIERPIVVANGKAVIGRPPENVLKVL
jgi:arsenate reductase